VALLEICETVPAAIQATNYTAPDLVFLDIKMPGQNGFAFLDAFERPAFEIIFVTAYDQFAIQALRRSAVDYLLKPVNADELAYAVKRADERLREKVDNKNYEVLRHNQKTNNPLLQKLAIPTKEGYEFISLEEVVKLKADRNYTRISTTTGKELLSTNHLKSYEESLPHPDFLRTHHSYIVNLQHVKSYVRGDGGHVVLSDGSIADISKRRKKEFLDLMA